MTQLQSIQLFEERNVRTVWDDEQEKWYFSVVDVVQVLMGSDYQAARKYWKVLKGRIVQEAGQPVTTCYQFKMRAADGKMRLTDVADQEQLFRIIQSVPSPKAEPFKQWMAMVASQRLDQMQDPELSIEQARNYWKVLKNRLSKEGFETVTNCNQFKMRAASFTPTDVLGLTQTAQKTQKRTCFARACHPDGYIRAIAPTRNERRLRRREL